MAIPPISDPLAARLSNLPGDLFAVVDGAAFDDVQGVLTKAGLDFRPLYLDEAKESGTLAAGPHLVPCPTNFHIEQLRDACGDEGIVWWAWPKGAGAGDEIFRHLRGIGMVEVPTNRSDADPGHWQDVAQPIPDFEAVLLRHADASVISRLLPILTVRQRSRFFGAAHALVMDFGGEAPLYAPRAADFPTPTPGLLRIESEQYERIAAETLNESRIEIRDHLREYADEEVAGLSADMLMKEIIRAEKVGFDLGLETNEAHILLAHLSILTGGAILTDPEFLQGFRAARSEPDDTMRNLFDSFVTLVERDEEAA